MAMIQARIDAPLALDRSYVDRILTKVNVTGRKERGKAYCPIVVGSGIVPLPEKKTVKNHKNGCIRMYETVTRFYQIAHN